MRTKAEREGGNNCFRRSLYAAAEAYYSSCLSIDAEDESESVLGGTTGGSLHAILHSNRAACLMALNRYPDAIEECRAALCIHALYMKVILHKSRCYTKLQRFGEAIAEYKIWLELVEAAREAPHDSSAFDSPCELGGPKAVLDSYVQIVRLELEEVYKAMKLHEKAEKRAVASREEAKLLLYQAALAKKCVKAREEAKLRLEAEAKKRAEAKARLRTSREAIRRAKAKATDDAKRRREQEANAREQAAHEAKIMFAEAKAKAREEANRRREQVPPMRSAPASSQGPAPWFNQANCTNNFAYWQNQTNQSTAGQYAPRQTFNSNAFFNFAQQFSARQQWLNQMNGSNFTPQPFGQPYFPQPNQSYNPFWQEQQCFNQANNFNNEQPYWQQANPNYTQGPQQSNASHQRPEGQSNASHQRPEGQSNASHQRPEGQSYPANGSQQSGPVNAAPQEKSPYIVSTIAWCEE
jgi:hypothetical protein